MNDSHIYVAYDETKWRSLLVYWCLRWHLWLRWPRNPERVKEERVCKQHRNVIGKLLYCIERVYKKAQMSYT